jgi:glycosyltransferase involved in cell wall biosynthesis
MTRKVLQLIETSGPGGAEKMLVNLVGELSKGEFHPIVCLRKEGWLNNQLQESGCETKIVPHNGYINSAWFRQLSKLIQAEEICVIHAHEFAMNTYGSILSGLTGVPVITTVHGKSYYHEMWRRRFAYRLIARWSKMVAVSEDIRTFLITQVGIKEDRVVTIHNGIDVKAYRDRSQGESAQQNGRTEYVIGAVGSLYPVKGHTYLLKALAIVLKSQPHVVCKIAGQGRLLHQLQAEAADLGIANQVTFLGLRHDIPQILQSIDVFVLPSLSEGLPLSVLEAMAAGKAVIATDVGGISEVVQNERTGFVVPPKDPEALASRILQLMADQAVAKRLGRAGREQVKRDFSLSTMTKQYETLYEGSLMKWGKTGTDSTLGVA